MAADVCGDQNDMDNKSKYTFLYSNVNLDNGSKLYYKRLSLKNDCRCKTIYPFRWKRNDFLAFIFVFLALLHIRTTAASSRSDFNSWGTDSPETDSRFSPEDASFETCLKGEYLRGYTLAEGREAGEYTNLGEVKNFNHCIELCCDNESCMVALMLTSPRSGKKDCFKVDCYEPDGNSCKPRYARKSKYHPYLFKRGLQTHRPLKVVSTEDHTMEENRGKRFCQKYTGTVCANSIDGSKYYYYSSNNQTVLDQRLQKPIKQISSRLTGGCRNYALQAICYRFFPQCLDPLHPNPVKICENECDVLTYGECATEFEDSNMLKYLQHIIPNCGGKVDNEYDASATCINLNTVNPTTRGLPTISNILPTTLPPVDQTLATTTTTHLQPFSTTYSPVNSSFSSTNTSVDSSNSNEDNGSGSQEETSTVDKDSVNHDFVTQAENSTSNVRGGFPDNNQAENAALNSSAVSSSDSSSGNISSEINSFTTKTDPTVANYTKKESAATIVDLPDDIDGKETELEELVLPSTTEEPVGKDPKEEEIRVSAGDNTEITLPDNQVSLYASTWPKETSEISYTYEWKQISAPPDGNGYIEGATTKNVKLSKLDVPGVYSFQLDVHASDSRHGVGYVNITVKQKARVNHPPRAEVYPKDQTILLPTNTVVLDASKSSDDVKIKSYKWEELKGPIKENTVFASATDSKILQLRNLIAGLYHFKLTVTDDEGETDSTEASVIVKEEQDYPPEANAGSDIIVRLPNNTAILNGDKSSDDKGIESYEWSKTAESPTCDMQGTDKARLTLSRLTEGTYVFNLKVTDAAQHSSNAKVKVIVLPEVNTKPVAYAGNDKELVYPDDSTTLDGSKSQDNSKIISYLWEQVSGPTKVKMVSANTAKVYVSNLKAGKYMMKLSVTDDKQLVGTDTVKIHVKKDHNEKPKAVTGPDQVINLPTRFCVIDGSKSTDDEFVETYSWARAGSSPAAGDVLNGSDHQAILKLANLIKGKYMFDLTVTDNKGLTGKDTVTITVKEDPHHLGLVELYLNIDVSSFTQENKKQLARQISVVMGVEKKYVHIEETTSVGFGKGVKILFFVNDPSVTRVLDGKYVADMLRSKIGNGGKLFEYKMDRVEPYICRSNCSGHGFCDTTTKQCVCDTFWMPNFFKANFGEKQINCDWSVLYLSVAVFAIFLFFVGVSWAVCFCFARNRRNKRRARYRALRSADPDGVSDEILLIPKRMKEKFSANSLTFTETDDDSEEDNTLFDKKRLVNGKSRMNGTANGKVKHRDHAM